jgi:hypothetical protein
MPAVADAVEGREAVVVTGDRFAVDMQERESQPAFAASIPPLPPRL